jgi:hypothetical protein
MHGKQSRWGCCCVLLKASFAWALSLVASSFLSSGTSPFEEVGVVVGWEISLIVHKVLDLRRRGK